MARICDRSPCDPLLNALGRTIFGSVDGNDGFYFLAHVTASQVIEVTIEYCPFCGTRLEEVPAIIVERFMRPRRKKRAVATGRVG